MSKKRLPIGSPPIIGYLHHAYPLAILSQGEEFLSWFYSHYIQVHCPSNLSDGPDQKRKRKFNFYRPPDNKSTYTPQLKVLTIPRRLVSEQNLIAFIQDTINQGEYIQLCIDEYYIPGKSAFQKRHLLHEILIYGYDNETSQLATLGFQQNGDFGSLTIDYKDIVHAYSNLDLNNHYDQDGISILRYDPTISPTFDFQLAIDSLKDYIQSQNSSQRFNMLTSPIEGAFGLQTYDCLIDQCNALFEHPEWFDIRPLHILWEHKKCMHNRLLFLEQHGYLDTSDKFSSEYAEITNIAQKVRMMMLKLRVSHDLTILTRILDGIEQLALNEKLLLQYLSESISLQQNHSPLPIDK